MNSQILRTERGQVLVLLVFSVVALLGFTALAIDGSMLYSDRRHAQSGADAASLAGGGAAALYLDNNHITYSGFDCSKNVTVNARNVGILAAIRRAFDNDYLIDASIEDWNGVVTSCGVEDRGGWLDKYIDFHTAITRDTETAFAQFVFGGALKNRVESVTRIRPRTGLGFGNAIVALREDCPNSSTGGVLFDGTNGVIIKGGGIYSNACIVADGTALSVEVTDGEIQCVGADCYTASGSPVVHPAPLENQSLLPPDAFDVPAVDCDLVPERGSHIGGGDILPGRYTQIRVNTPISTLNMAPGLYCMDGNITFLSGTIIGNGVTIYMRSGDFNTSGIANVTLVSPPPNCKAPDCPPPVPGILIYMPESNPGEVSLLGTADSEYTGVVYAPTGVIEVGGAASEISTVHCQLIGDTVQIHGTTTIDITYREDENYLIPARLELHK